MVAIGAAIKIGQIIYRIVTVQSKIIKDAYKGFPPGVSTGVSHGTAIGTIIGSVIEYYKDPEDLTVGLPETSFNQRDDNRFGKTRGKAYKSIAECRRITNRGYRYCKKHSRR